MTLFADFPLDEQLKRGLAEMGFTEMMPIQEKVLPIAQERRDVIGCAQTGTGKTAAFLVPIIDGLLEMPKAKRFRPQALVLLPTRELARQVGDVFASLAKYTGLKAAVIHGGVELGGQDRDLDLAAAVIIATPGRLIEHLERKALKFTDLEFLVLDEADRMMDEGFLPEIRRIIDALPERRQTMLFSATMPKEMEKLAHQILIEPARVQIGLVGPREQVREMECPIAEHQKTDFLRELLSREKGMEKVIVFVRTRARARELAPMLGEVTQLPTAELHAELTMAQRTETLQAFRDNTIKVMVATDVAARGLDIEGITHVVNYDVPNTPDDYIHRIGRTARVDREGVAYTFVALHEQALFLSIQATVRRPIGIMRLEGFKYEAPEGTEIEAKPLRVNRRSGARPVVEPSDKSDKKKKSPFTRTGQLRAEHRDTDLEEDKTVSRRKLERRIKNKKLPHQRKQR